MFLSACLTQSASGCTALPPFIRSKDALSADDLLIISASSSERDREQRATGEVLKALLIKIVINRLICFQTRSHQRLYEVKLASPRLDHILPS